LLKQTTISIRITSYIQKEFTMNRRLYFLIALIIICLNGYSQDSTAQFQDSIHKPVIKLGERTAIKGTHISLLPPDKFTYSDKIKGFVHAGSASSLAVTEAEGISWIQACQSINQQTLNGQSVTLLTTEDVTLKDGTTGRFIVMRILLISNDSTKQDLEFERLMLFAGDYNRTVLINANYPALMKSLIYDTLRESMLSVEISETINVPAPDEK